MSILANRYASDQMKDIWSPRSRIIAERRLWITVMKTQSELGFDIPVSAIKDYERVLENIDLDSIDKRERELDRKSTRLNSSHPSRSRMPSSA